MDGRVPPRLASLASRPSQLPLATKHKMSSQATDEQIEALANRLLDYPQSTIAEAVRHLRNRKLAD